MVFNLFLKFPMGFLGFLCVFLWFSICFLNAFRSLSMVYMRKVWFRTPRKAIRSALGPFLDHFGAILGA